MGGYERIPALRSSSAVSPQHVGDVNDKGEPLVGSAHRPAQDLEDITFQDQALIPVWEKVLQK